MKELVSIISKIMNKEIIVKNQKLELEQNQVRLIY